MNNETLWSFLSPTSVVESARKAHPAFKYAIAVGGLFGLVTIATRFGLHPATLVFGAVVVVVLMVLFLVFAQAAALRRSRLSVPAVILVYAVLVIVLSSAALLACSAFFNTPLPIRSAIVEKMGAGARPNAEDIALPRLSAKEETALALALADPEACDRGAWKYPLRQDLTYRGFSDVEATTTLSTLVARGFLEAKEVDTEDTLLGKMTTAPAYRVTALGITYAHQSDRVRDFQATYIYTIRLKGTREMSQPFLERLRKLSFVQQQTRFVKEDNPCSIAVFSYEALDEQTIKDMALLFGLEVQQVVNDR